MRVAATCERLAREAVGFHLSASVFSVVGRLALAAANREQADDIQTRAGGIGIGAHAWGLAAKLREVDEVMTPKLQETIREFHPELSFRTMAGRPLEFRKKTEEGELERIKLLIEAGFPEGLFQRVHPRLKRFEAAPDVGRG